MNQNFENSKIKMKAFQAVQNIGFDQAFKNVEFQIEIAEENIGNEAGKTFSIIREKYKNVLNNLYLLKQEIQNLKQNEQEIL